MVKTDLQRTDSQKKVFIIHGWGGYPEEGWFPWLKGELEKRGFLVAIPAMPHSSAPEIKSWVSTLKKKVGSVDDKVYLVGHSIGCQTILRYLEKLPAGAKVGGAVLVAGWFTLTNLETKEDEAIAKPWLELPISFEKVKEHLSKSVVVLSDNDPFVPLIENKEMFEKKLGAKVVIEHHKGHFSEEDKITKLPSVLDWLLGLAK